MRRLFTSLILICMIAGGFASSSAAAAFPDVSDSNRFVKEIQYLLDEGIITGYSDGQFHPKGQVTRGQAAIMIGRAMGYAGEPQKTQFEDVDSSVALSGYVAAAVEDGIINGYPDGTYRPANAVTRAEMALFLYRAFDLGYEGEPLYFSDVVQGMKAYEAIQQLSASGITEGYAYNKFGPYHTLTREQFAAFMARMMNPVEFAVEPEEVEVAFLDVGQGDAIYLEYADGEAVLIDAGPSAEQISRALDEIGAKEINTLIVTHPDSEHIGGAAWVIENYGVDRVYDSGLSADTEVFTDYLAAIQANGVAVETVEIGDDLSVDPSVSLEVLFVNPEAAELDDGGMVLKLTSEIWEFLLAGDATPEVQQYLIDNYELEARILKVPAHGDGRYYTYPFVDEVDPHMSILSYGNNPSGLPDEAVVNDLRAGGSSIYDTQAQGSIIFVITEEFMDMNVHYHLHGYGQLVPDIRFTEKDLEGEVVTLTNYDRVNADLTGFKLVSVNGDEVYEFPDGFILRSGLSVNITSGLNAVHNPPESLKWTEDSVWEDSGDPSKLYEPNDFLLVETP